MKKLSKDEFMRISHDIMGMQQAAVEKAGLSWFDFNNHLPAREEMWEQLKDILYLNAEPQYSDIQKQVTDTVYLNTMPQYSNIQKPNMMNMEATNDQQ